MSKYKIFKKIATISLPTLTLIIGLFVGSHYNDITNHLETIIPSGHIIDNYVSSPNKNNSSSDNDSSIVLDRDYLLPTKTEINIDRIWPIWEIVRSMYYQENPVSGRDVLYGITKGMINSLGDEYSIFMNPDESEDFQVEVNWEVEGIGVELIYRESLMQVISVIKKGPAYNAGIRTDDIILKVDDVNVEDLGFYKAIKQIRGKKGTQVKITVYRPNEEETVDFEIIRDKVEVENVEWEMLDGNIAHLLINRFTDDVMTELNTVSTEIIASDVSGIILDLRDNGGGYMDQAVYVADFFISDGLIVSRRFNDGKIDNFYATNKTLFSGYDLKVLVNRNSASASEIVAGAIQDSKVGEIWGEATYGKGSVQQAFNFLGGTLKLTTAKWFTPNNKSIDKSGIIPDHEIQIPEEHDESLDYYLDVTLQSFSK